MKIEPTIIVDSREQRAWKFENLPSETGSLRIGENAALGVAEQQVA